MCVSVCWCCMWVMMGDVVVGGVCSWSGDGSVMMGGMVLEVGDIGVKGPP